MPKDYRNRNLGSHARSLYNRTSRGGWSRVELEALNLCVQRYGVGRWRDTLSTSVLKTKTRTQLNLMVQRMMGQQSLVRSAPGPSEIRSNSARGSF